MVLSVIPSLLRFVAKPRLKACQPCHFNSAFASTGLISRLARLLRLIGVPVLEGKTETHCGGRRMLTSLCVCNGQKGSSACVGHSDSRNPEGFVSRVSQYQRFPLLGSAWRSYQLPQRGIPVPPHAVGNDDVACPEEDQTQHWGRIRQ